MAESIKTLRASGGDYTSVQTWWATEGDDDHVTNTTSPVLEAYNDWPSGLNESVDFIEGGSYVASATHRPIFRVAAGEGGTNKKPITNGFDGFYLYKDINTAVVGLYADYMLVEGIGVYNPRTTANAYQAGVRIGGIESELRRCIVESAEKRSINYHSGYPATNCLVRRNFCYVSSGVGISFSSDIGLYNNTVINLGTGSIGLSSGTPSNAEVAKNNLVFGFTTAYSNMNGTDVDYNATDTSQTIGANDIASITSAEFVDAANDDYHLASTSSLKTAGANLYTDGSAVDIDGDVLPNSAWPIGADLYVASGGTNNYSIVGDVTASTGVNATMLYTAAVLAHSIVGDVTVSTSVNAAMLYTDATAAPAIVGEVTVQVSPAATMLHTTVMYEFAIVGDATAQVTPAATMQYTNVTQGLGIVGDVTIAHDVAATMQYTNVTQGLGIVGDVTLTTSVNAAMLYTFLNSNHAIVGDVTIRFNVADPTMIQTNEAVARLMMNITGEPTYMAAKATFYGKLPDETIDDAEMRWLVDQGATPGTHVCDMWHEFLTSEGHIGTTDDMELAYYQKL